MLDKEKLENCHNCAGKPIINMKVIKIECPDCGLKVGYKSSKKSIPTLKLKEMLISLWNDLPNRKIKDA